MSPELDALVKLACAQELGGDKLGELCALAAFEGHAESVLFRLMTAGTAAARVNLRGAKGLVRGHETGASRAAVDEIVRTRKMDRYVQVQQNRADGLPFGVTWHAFERYVGRYMVEHEAGMDHLLEQAKQARPVKDKTFAGDEQWVSPEGIVFVVRRDTHPPARVCVTVLPKVDEDKPWRKRCR